MRKIQLTLVQIDNYGPWTVTPEPRKESDLQSLQAGLFAELEKRFGTRKGLVFSTRFDNMLAITNGISMGEHRKIQNAINKKFPVTVSMGVGAGRTPYEAQVKATLALQHAGGSRSKKRTGALVGECVGDSDSDWVQLVHIDVNHSTLITDSQPIYDTHVQLQKTQMVLMSSLMKRNALLFYVGGDNFIAPSNGLNVHELTDVFSEVKHELGFGLKAGVGAAKTAERAAFLASKGLHEIRGGKFKKQITYKTD